mmetsp:Transcript_18956/g.75589  ORF Transcript_18956/g.75589 Transcript_18956/m.75589 type:complete len:227 (-) Transcript_18956:163-843(-)
MQRDAITIALVDVDERLRGVVPVAPRRARRRPRRRRIVRPRERDRAVQSHRDVELVLEDVEVVEPVRLGVSRVCADGPAERELGRVLGEAEDRLRAGERHVDADGRRPARHVVPVAAERLGEVLFFLLGGGLFRRRLRRLGGLVALDLLAAVGEAREAVLPVPDDLEALAPVPRRAVGARAAAALLIVVGARRLARRADLDDRGAVPRRRRRPNHLRGANARLVVK